MSEEGTIYMWIITFLLIIFFIITLVYDKVLQDTTKLLNTTTIDLENCLYREKEVTRLKYMCDIIIELQGELIKNSKSVENE
jgi:intracellular septation protein A